MFPKAALSVALIVVIEFCERLCYYTFQGTQKFWLQNRGYGNAQSTSLNQIFGLLSFVSCFLGGWMADTNFGRYKTIILFVVLYVVGCFMSALAANPSSNNVTMYLFGTMALIATGTGGIKPNVCTFGADQIDPNLPDVQRRKESFFMNFYLTINVGCLIAFGFLATTATNGLPPYIQKEDGYYFSYMVAAAFMALALVLFIGGTALYRQDSFKNNSEPVLSLFFGTLYSGRRQAIGLVALFGWSLVPFLIILAVWSAFADNQNLTYLSLGSCILCVGCLCFAHYNNKWLGNNGVTKCLDCIPVLLIGNIIFNVKYNAMSGAFISQSCQMDTRIGSGDNAMQLSGTFLNLADSIAVIAFTPLIDKLFIPMIERTIRRPVTLHMKVYAGIAVAIGAQLVAALLEVRRFNAPVLPIPSKCAPLQDDKKTHVHMSDMSAFWMMIPFAMIGIGEVLVNPVMQHFAYEGAPASMRSLLQAFNLFAMGGMPNAISSGLSLATAEFTPNNLNDGNLTYVYYINSMIGVFGCFLYFLVSRPSKAAAEADLEQSRKIEEFSYSGKLETNSDASDPIIKEVPFVGRGAYGTLSQNSVKSVSENKENLSY